jgi:hypothetical protein
LGGIAYVIGLAQNAVLLRSGAAALSEARRRFQATKQTVQHFDAFAYAAESWPQERHVVMKAEVSEHGANPRFVVTSLVEFAPALLYHGYCERGQCEVCQSQPVKMAWRPLRLVIATIIYLRGLVKREDIRDVDLFSRDDDFFDQTLGHGLAIGKGEMIEVFA